MHLERFNCTFGNVRLDYVLSDEMGYAFSFEKTFNLVIYEVRKLICSLPPPSREKLFSALVS